THIHDPYCQFAIGVADEREAHRGATLRTPPRGFRHLKLHEERRKLANSETFVGLGDALAHADVTVPHHAGEGRADLRLVELCLQAAYFRLRLFEIGLPTGQVKFRTLGFKFRVFEVRFAAQTVLA